MCILFPHFPVKCVLGFPWTYRIRFDAFSEIANIFEKLTNNIFDIDNIVNNLKSANILAFKEKQIWVLVDP